MNKLVLGAGIAAAVLTGSGALTADAADPADWSACSVDSNHRGQIVLPAWCTVAIEHEDRMARLRRLSALDGLAVGPQFYEYVIPRRDIEPLVPNFPADVPILRVVFPERVLFDVDSAELKPEAEQVLQIVAESLRREPPDVALFIAGHTDATASDAYNFNLSLRRADTVARALKGRGVGLASIFRVGFGEAVPIATNETEDGRRLNRRVEFIFAAKPEAAALWLARQSIETCYAADEAALAKCRKTVAVAEEVVSSAPPVRLAPKPVKQARITAPGRVEVAPPAGRRYTLDLGRHAVTIAMPRR